MLKICTAESSFLMLLVHHGGDEVQFGLQTALMALNGNLMSG